MNKPNNQSAAIEYPVDFDLKIIMGVACSVVEQRQQIEELLTNIKVPFKQWRHKVSAKGNFVSHTLGVHIDSHQELQNMYAALKKLPDVKMAL